MSEATPTRYDDALRLRLRSALAAHDRDVKPDEGLIPAAVALVIVPDDRGRATAVLTRRAAKLRRHSGQFALPGGRLDPGETARQAALRELHEEVGLERGPEHVLGELDDHVARSGFHMTPVVVWGGRGELRPSPDEVARAYRVPLDEIAAPETGQHLDFDGDGRRSFALSIVGTLVFAPTAALLLQIAHLAVHGEMLSVDHYEQPRFAWR
ncbi:MAG: CoA pyrophosphatase [Acidobacteriota bacterium]